ncbi:MAG TPA: serine hydrolase domain-containing protein, partial [candidate division Zixibacteria bacterium]|nr:serine hydrolase domain-containing protein [candidate division Zixibacteria bacterium]
VAGWSLAITAALLLNLVVVAHMAAPESRTVSGAAAASPTPRPPMAVSPVGESTFRIPPWVTLPRAAAERAPVDAARASEFQAAVDRARAQFKLASLAVGVGLGGERGWAGASGTAADKVTALDGDSAFGIASITKTYTAAVVLQLVEEGRLSLEDEVATLLPELKIPAAVTVRQLLNHTSGLPDLLAPMRQPMEAEPTRVWSTTEVVARVGSDAWFPPGAGYGYSNTNYVLLGLIVEHLTGTPFGTQLHERLIDPLGLRETGALIEDGAPPLMSPAWASAFGASGYMYSSVSDLVRWGSALYHGRVLLPVTRTQMLRMGEDGYGLGVQRIELGRHVGHGHSGLLQGYTSLLVDLPADGLILAVVGAHSSFAPTELLTWSPEDGSQPSILDLALAAR